MRAPHWGRIDARRAAAVVAATVSLIASAAHGARNVAVEKWLASSADDVALELKQHPRFRDAAVRVVVMRDGKPTARPNQLELDLKDALQRRIAGRPGVTLSSSNVIEHGDLAAGGSHVCPPAVQYLIGLEVVANSSADDRATLRALDLVENSYVAGFRYAWRGTLSRAQLRDARQQTVDRSFLGDRSVPYEVSETDLIAKRLGLELRCALMREVTGEYVLEPSAADDDSADSLASLTELIGNHLNGISTVRWSASPADATAILQGKAHRVDGDLHQYWLTVMPVDAAGDLKPLSASVYVRMPERYMTAEIEARTPHQNALFESLALVRQHSGVCRTTQPYSFRTTRVGSVSDCWALRIKTRDDAVVFVLHHQQNNGLVRLADKRCSDRPTARISRAQEGLTFALPTDLLREEWRSEDTWRLEPDADTYYAIAVSDSKAARELAAHVRQLPERCSASVRPGYEGAELANWLSRLTAQFDKWQANVDWDAIRIKNVY